MEGSNRMTDPVIVGHFLMAWILRGHGSTAGEKVAFLEGREFSCLRSHLFLDDCFVIELKEQLCWFNRDVFISSSTINSLEEQIFCWQNDVTWYYLPKSRRGNQL